MDGTVPPLDVHVEEKSLETFLERLEFLEEIWQQVGEALEVPEGTLRAIQSGPQANDHKKSLKKVIKHWEETNLDNMMWAKLIERLCENQKIFRRHKHRLTELATTYRADVPADNDGIN